MGILDIDLDICFFIADTTKTSKQKYAANNEAVQNGLSNIFTNLNGMLWEFNL